MRTAEIFRRAAIGCAGFAAASVMLAAPAAATLTGPCEAQGTFFPDADADSGSPPGPHVVNARQGGTILIPDKGSVDWQGQIGDGQPTDPRQTSGNLQVVLPPIVDDLFGDIAGFTEVYTWGSDDETSTFESGRETYSVPDWVPGGITVVVAGGHSDALGNCAGTVRLKIPGSAVTSPVTIVSVIATGGTVITMVAAGVQTTKPI